MHSFCHRISSRTGRCGTFVLIAVLLFCLALLAGCKSEIYQGLTENQANAMLATLLKRGIRVEKQAAGKNGFAIAVDDDQIIQTLQILKDNNLPGEDFTNLGKVFSGQGMVASPTEEQSRLAYAISQELADTFSCIDGVLTARVHIVLAGTDQVTDTRTPPSAAVFLRHLPDSQVAGMVPKIRELTANAVPELNFERVSVMLLPVRETVSVSMAATPRGGLLSADTEDSPLLFRICVFLAAVVLAVTTLIWLRIRWREGGSDAVPGVSVSSVKEAPQPETSLPLSP